jgi:hypothetical protein
VLHLAGLAQVVARHMGSYVELMAQAAGEYRASLRRRVLLAAGAMVMAFTTVAAAWTTGLALLWDTEWRIAYCILSALVSLGATVGLAVLAVRRPHPGPHVRTLREEAAQDLELLQEWRRTT